MEARRLARHNGRTDLVSRTERAVARPVQTALKAKPVDAVITVRIETFVADDQEVQPFRQSPANRILGPRHLKRAVDYAAVEGLDDPGQRMLPDLAARRIVVSAVPHVGVGDDAAVRSPNRANSGMHQASDKPRAGAAEPRNKHTRLRKLSLRWRNGLAHAGAWHRAERREIGEEPLLLAIGVHICAASSRHFHK